AHSSYADARYLGLLQHEIRRFDPQARRLEAIDRDLATLRARARAIHHFRARPKLDMDTLGEIPKLVPPPGWVTSLELDRDSIQIGGEAEQVAELLKAFDSSR